MTSVAVAFLPGSTVLQPEPVAARYRCIAAAGGFCSGVFCSAPAPRPLLVISLTCVGFIHPGRQTTRLGGCSLGIKATL